MPDAAIVVLAGTESPSDLGRVVNGLQTGQEFVAAGDNVEIIFDGAGTQWIPELEDESHDYHSLYAELTEHMSACHYCANAYEVANPVEESPAELLDEHEGHPSIRSLVTDGYEIITY
ncbi:hypothetical protein GS429_02165 [Natronorubrum sp. JWXQ-INN-674]|uniref:DsrE family protein n=1 Tax=Natronorubrum halalkaliphilum TaxID=2691917 RepID=A0A6B0VIL0_9EURY|nr:DsrE family protein [Natronorubrum halalkaliphilum]MXV60895.1 hypothetical protein [Natronorubrum halalkaliphilum]